MSTVFQLSEHILSASAAGAYDRALRAAEADGDGGPLDEHVDGYLRPLGLQLVRGWTEQTHHVLPTPKGWELMAHVTTSGDGPVVSRVGDSLWTLEAGGTLIEVGEAEPEPVPLDVTVAHPVDALSRPVLALMSGYLSHPSLDAITAQRDALAANRATHLAALDEIDRAEAHLQALALSGGTEYLEALVLVGAPEIAEALGRGWDLRSTGDGKVYLAPTS